MATGCVLTLLTLLCVTCSGLQVDPPEDLLVVDPGHLGHLEITWSAPSSLLSVTAECPVLYQLDYFNAYRDRWTAIRTPRRSYRAQFDLMKDIRVRVHTLLSGPCTNGTMVKSTKYTELVQKPPTTGVAVTEVKDFVCVYYNMENMECNWGRNPKMPAASQQTLYFWHKDLEQAQECPEYIMTGGVRSGCSFKETALPDFTDINFCINGSSPEGPLRPTYASLQIQNHVKPGTTEKLYFHARPGAELELEWECPAGNVPEQCLEWEVEHSQEGADGKTASKQIGTTLTSLTLPLVRDSKRNCFRVRSKLHMYCVDKSIWSEWSRPVCHPETRETLAQPEGDKVQVYVFIAIAVIAMLLLSLCMGTVLKLRKTKEEKTLLPFYKCVK